MNPLLLALVQAGIITRDDADRINRSLDPDAARAWAEQQLAIATQQGLSAQRMRLVDLVRAKGGPLSDDELAGFFYEEHDRFYNMLRPTLEEIALDRAAAVAVRASSADMWNLINEQVMDWTQTYYTSPDPSFVGSVRSLDETTRRQVADAFSRWQTGELNDGRQGGLPALIQELERSFEPVRAERIAVTETTRIFSEAELAAANADPDIEYVTWDTAVDEKVCEICLPLDGLTVRKGDEFAPGIRSSPAHVNCRCGITAMTKATADALAAEGALKLVGQESTNAN